MSISSLNSALYTALQNSTSGSSSNSATTAKNGSGSSGVGAALLSALAQTQAASGTASNSLLQEFVSLSSRASGQTDNSAQTYNAKGLMQRIQSNMMLNDPLLQSDSSATDGSANNSLLQQVMGSQASSSGTSGNSLLQAITGSGTQAAQGTGISSLSATQLAQLIENNPSLAGSLAQSQTNQSLLSLLG